MPDVLFLSGSGLFSLYYGRYGCAVCPFPESSSLHPLTAQELLTGNISSAYICTQYRLNNGDWTAWLYRPSREQLITYRYFQLTAVLLTVLCIAISFLVASYLSRIMARPLEKLSADLLLVEQGHYETAGSHEDDSGRSDEVGQLQRAFRAMVIQLNHLINEVLIAQIEQQKYELRVLQSQINPHFLYNSLSLINVQAIMAGQTGISQMSQLLSTFYRTMLNKGKSITTIRDELENTKAYVSIQQIMHSWSFDVTYDIDERTLPFSVLNLIIQPLAENAILHGLDHRQAPGKGMLTISCRLEEETILFQVIDNGCGMSESNCQSIRSCRKLCLRYCFHYPPGFRLAESQISFHYVRFARICQFETSLDRRKTAQVPEPGVERYCRPHPSP